ncbi:family 78 glycoside hydrolase catalytic domain [Paenibacillus sp. GYB003]|uniref:family 78 glycoside hydrolase catalytic domain n=1 Tax=Paenibacillus sp. GYB003 TaxID=2994392 RepID=UPI002F96A6E8
MEGNDTFVKDGPGSAEAGAAHRLVRQRPAHERIAWDRGTAIIWHPSEVETHYEQPKQSFCRFRRAFELPGPVARGELRIFADTRYVLYVNGRYVGRGPCRSDPRWQSYDVWDVGPLLAPGLNAIAVFVLHYGYGTGHSVHRIPALLAECAVEGKDGGVVRIASDGRWTCSFHPAYERNAPRINGCQGPIEICDARRADALWIRPEYDDSGWERAKGRNRELSPFWNLVPRDIPLLEEGTAEASGVVGIGELVERPEAVERLHKQIMAEEESLTVRPLPGVPAANYAVPRTEKGKATVVTFDFGRLEVGCLQVEATGTEGDVLDVVYAEELWEGKALLNANNNRSVDRFVLAAGRNELEVAFGWKAFRYVQIRVRNFAGAVTFHRVGVRTRHYPVAKPASFACPDRELERIWAISAHTLRSCMQDGFLDSSSREQQQWMGDGRVQAVYNYYYSGDSRLHAKLLKQVGQSQDESGMTKSRYPDGHHNYPPIPSFCLQWICSFDEYAFYAADSSLVGPWWPNIVQALRWFTAYLNEEGVLADVPYWPFIDWGEMPAGPGPDVTRGGIVCALNLQYLEALRVAVRFARQVNDAEAADVFGRLADRLAEGIERLLWNEQAGAYADCVVNGAMSGRVSEITNCLALLHLHDPGEQRAERIVRSVFVREESGHPVLKASPYFMLYVYRALEKHGRAELVLDMIRDRYGAMAKAGATTTWENWSLFYKTAQGEVRYQSASHAWAAMPIVFMAEQILGLTPSAPGFKQVRVSPRLYGMDYAEGTVSTPAGKYRIGVRRRGDRIGLELDVPEGAEAIVRGRVCPAGRHALDWDAREEA